jgi:hypothetical protein
MSDTNRTNNSKRADEIQQAIDELEQLGLIRRNGKFRRGKPVYVATELGRAALINMPDGIQ